MQEVPRSAPSKTLRLRATICARVVRVNTAARLRCCVASAYVVQVVALLATCELALKVQAAVR